MFEERFGLQPNQDLHSTRFVLRECVRVQAGVLAQEAIVEALACRHFLCPAYTHGILHAQDRKRSHGRVSSRRCTHNHNDHLFLGVVRSSYGVALADRERCGLLNRHLTSCISRRYRRENIIPPDTYVEIDASAVVKDPQAGMQVLLLKRFRNCTLSRRLQITPWGYMLSASDVGKSVLNAGGFRNFLPLGRCPNTSGRLVHVLAEQHK
jgi:hypothetical protein